MRYLEAHRTRLGCETPDEVFTYFMRTLKQTVTQWDCFVDWDLVLVEVQRLEGELRLLDSLIGSKSIEEDFACLLRQHPTVARVLPFLIARRSAVFTILVEYGLDKLDYRCFDLLSQAAVHDGGVAKTVEFAKSCGLLALLRDGKIKSLVDYAVGVAVGLNSGTRDLRAAETMRSIVEHFLGDVCTRNRMKYLSETTSGDILEEFGIDVSGENPKHIIDFAVWSGSELYLVRADFCADWPSEIKARLDANRDFARRRQEDGHPFIWVTDGKLWRSSSKPLRKAFKRVDFVLNLEMVSRGLLEDIIAP